MIVLDTTVLVYAKGADHPLRDPCRELIGALADRRLAATTTIEVIQEFVHVRARHRGREDAAALGRDYAELLSPLLSPTGDDLRQGLDWYARSERLGAFDAVLAAAAAGAGARALVSADAAFADLGAVAHVTPDADGVAELLRTDEARPQGRVHILARDVLLPRDDRRRDRRPRLRPRAAAHARGCAGRDRIA